MCLIVSTVWTVIKLTAVGLALIALVDAVVYLVS